MLGPVTESEGRRQGHCPETLLGPGCTRLSDHGRPLPPGQQARPSRCRPASPEQMDLNALARARRPGRSPREEPPRAGGGERAKLWPRFPTPPQGQRRPPRRVGTKAARAEVWRGRRGSKKGLPPARRAPGVPTCVGKDGTHTPADPRGLAFSAPSTHRAAEPYMRGPNRDAQGGAW